VPPGSPESLKEGVRGQVKQLVARLKKGEEFDKMAKQYSQDAGSAAKGGTLDEFTRGQMAPAFEQAAFALKPGELSDVVETPFGFHIIRLDERLPSERLSFEASRERIKQHILNTRRQKAVERLVATLRAKAKIETYL